MALLARCARIGLENGIDPCGVVGSECAARPRPRLRRRGRHVGHIGVFGDGVAAQPQPPRDLRTRDPRGVHRAYIIDIVQGHGHLLHPFRAGPSKAFARKTIRRGPRPWFLGCGPHDQNAQFLMRTVLKSRRSFGPIVIAHQHCGVRCPRRTGAARRGCGRGARRAAGAEVP